MRRLRKLLLCGSLLKSLGSCRFQVLQNLSAWLKTSKLPKSNSQQMILRKSRRPQRRSKRRESVILSIFNDESIAKFGALQTEQIGFDSQAASKPCQLP